MPLALVCEEGKIFFVEISRRASLERGKLCSA